MYKLALYRILSLKLYMIWSSYYVKKQYIELIFLLLIIGLCLLNMIF